MGITYYCAKCGSTTPRHLTHRCETIVIDQNAGAATLTLESFKAFVEKMKAEYNDPLYWAKQEKRRLEDSICLCHHPCNANWPIEIRQEAESIYRNQLNNLLATYPELKKET
jgi:hypothetical protein